MEIYSLGKRQMKYDTVESSVRHTGHSPAPAAAGYIRQRCFLHLLPWLHLEPEFVGTTRFVPYSLLELPPWNLFSLELRVPVSSCPSQERGSA